MPKEYVTVDIQLEPELYCATKEVLSEIDCTVEQYAVLCMLKTVRYTQRMPHCADMATNDLVHLVANDAIEVLELLHANRACEIDDHK